MTWSAVLVAWLVAGAVLEAQRPPSPTRQMPIHPFTREEFLSVYRRLLPEVDAIQLANASMADSAERQAKTNEGVLAFQSIEATDLSDDTLILLSFISTATKAKVDVYRSLQWGGAIPKEIEAQWLRRVAELRAWADAGYPR